MEFQKQPNRKNRGRVVLSFGTRGSGLPGSTSCSLDNQRCKVKEVSECGRHCPLLEGLASSPRHIFGSRSVVLNLLWILGPSENLRKAMESKKQRYALIHKDLRRVSGILGKTLCNPSINFPGKGVSLEADRSKCQFRAETPTSLAMRQKRN